MIVSYLCTECENMNLVAQYLTRFIIIIVYALCHCEAEWEIVSTDPKSRYVQVVLLEIKTKHREANDPRSVRE